MFSVRKRQEESKTVTWQHAKELSLLILITNGLFPISFSQVSSCLSPTELSCSPITSPPHHEAMLQGPAGCSVPVPCLSAGSSCWASRCLSDLWKPPSRPQPPWPGARSCCHHQTHRKGGTFPARRTAQLCARWGNWEGDGTEAGVVPSLCQQQSSRPQRQFCLDCPIYLKNVTRCRHGVIDAFKSGLKACVPVVSPLLLLLPAEKRGIKSSVLSVANRAGRGKELEEYLKGTQRTRIPRDLPKHRMHHCQ